MTPTRLPRRHWWHFYCVLETSLRTGALSVVSWHTTRPGATYKVADLIATYQGNVVIHDWFEWRPMSVRHQLVRDVMYRRHPAAAAQ